jgi:hypothetical protein
VQLEEYAIVRGKAYGPQVRIDNVPREPGRKVNANGVLEAKLPAGHHSLSITCRDVTRDSVREASTKVNIVVRTGYFYQLDAEFRANICDARLVAEEVL